MRSRSRWYLILLLNVFLSVTDTFGQWTGKVVLNDYTTGQPALEEFQGKLHLGWVGADSNRTVNVMSSFDGLNYGNKVTLWGMTSPDGIGVALSEIPNCGVLALSYLGRGNRYPNFTKSSDGLNWSPQSTWWGFVASATPALSPIVFGAGGFVAPGGSGYTYARYFDDCSLSSWMSYCWLPNCADNVVRINGSPFAREFHAFASQPDGGQLFIDLTPFGSHWSDQGPSGTCDEVTGYCYIAWKGGGKKINIANLGTGAHIISSDWTDYTPAIAAFQGQLFVAWRGANPGAVNVAKLNPF
jgi:hypothetical protein